MTQAIPNDREHLEPLRRRFEEFRGTQTRRVRLPDTLWQETGTNSLPLPYADSRWPKKILFGHAESPLENAAKRMSGKQNRIGFWPACNP